MERIYLDNAATSWPKPETVYLAVDRYQRESGAAVGRGAYREAVEVERLVSRVRQGIAELIGAGDSKRIAFAVNCTAALNLAIHGLLQSGDHVVTSCVEHNSVLRPLRHLAEAGVIHVTWVGCNEKGIIDPDDVRRAISSHTRLVAISHASNVTGAIQPVAEIGRIAREHDVFLLLDAAQTAGHLPIDVEAIGVHLLAASGHKGLLGPLGTGFLYVASGVETRLNCIVQGGTGTTSEVDRQPETLPDKYEAGNLNAPGLVGLEAAVRYIAERGQETLLAHERKLTIQLIQGLRQIEGLRLYGPMETADRLGVVSVTLDGYDPQELAAMLDSAYRIQARAGLHCAPRMHRALGTLETGGTLRLSVGPFNTAAQIAAVIDALSEVAASRPAVGP
jgi:cysteine desulfurase family protein